MMTDLAYRPALREDAGLLVQIYNAAFRADFLRFGQCPAYGRTVAQMEASIARYPKTVILSGGKPVGVISAQEYPGGYVYLGCLCVLPEYQGKGIGTQAMAKLESLYPNWQQIDLTTPADRPENIRFYTEKCGFSIAGEDMDGAVRVVKFVKKREK